MNPFYWGALCFVLSVAGKELWEWAPWIAKQIVLYVVKRQPVALQERLSEELLELLDSTPGKLWKICRACSLWCGFSRDNILLSISKCSSNATLRAIDLCVASVVLILVLPLYGLIVAIIRLTSNNSAHATQVLIGRGGKPFSFYTFRVQVPDAELMLNVHLAKNPEELHRWNGCKNLKHDPRFTPFGYILRRSGLNLLPLFFNVLKGDMSLIGPSATFEKDQGLFGTHWKDYCEVRPGLTGLWQLSEPYMTTARRIELDIAYLKHRSLWTNLRLMARALKVSFFHARPTI